MELPWQRDPIVAALAPDEEIRHRAPGGWRRLASPLLFWQAIVALLTLLLLSVTYGQFSGEALVLAGGMIGIQIFTLLSADLAVTNQRVLWSGNRFTGELQSAWLDDLRCVELIYHPFSASLRLAGDLGELLTTRSFAGVEAAASYIARMHKPARRFVPETSVRRLLAIVAGAPALASLSAFLVVTVVFMNLALSAEGLFGLIFYLVLLALLLPPALLLASLLGEGLAIAILRFRLNAKAAELLLHLGRPDDGDGLELWLLRQQRKARAALLSILFGRKIHYLPDRYATLRYGD